MKIRQEEINKKFTIFFETKRLLIKMTKPLIYHQNVIDTYLYLIKENIHLATNLLKENEKKIQPYDPLKKYLFYKRKAKHLQIMTLIGITAEHLMKIILLNRGYVINIKKVQAKFNRDFLMRLEEANKTLLTQEKLDQLYDDSTKNLDIEIINQLIPFEECVFLFNNSCGKNYFDSVGEYTLNPRPDLYNGDEYFGYKIIKPAECLKIIQKIRNSYLHLAEAQREQQGIIWYFINFLIWLSKKEYPNFFKDEKFVGNELNKNLFEDGKRMEHR